MDLRATVSALLLDAPFYGVAATLVTLSQTTEIPTIGLAGSLAPGIRVNPDWLASLSPEHAKGALAHELLHLLLLHPLRRGDREPALWTICCDLSVNEQLPSSWLPDRAVTVPLLMRETGGSLPRGKSAEAYYSLLLGTETMPALLERDGHIRLITRDNREHTAGDLHLSDPDNWDEGHLAALLAETVRKASRDAPVPEMLVAELEAVHRPASVNWRSVLKRFMCGRGRMAQHASWKRESRRHEGYAGTRRTEGIDLLLAIDESGSVSPSAYAVFFAEVQALSRLAHVNVQVSRFDTSCSPPMGIRAYLEDRSRRRSGGTDFRPVFEMADRVRAPLLVIFTDGDGPAPATSNQKVLWVLTPEGRKPEGPGEWVRFQPGVKDA